MTQAYDITLTQAVAAVMRDAADRAIMLRYQKLTASEIKDKAADDLVTIADTEAEVILAEGLARLLPEATIVGEEAVAADPTLMAKLGDDLCWIIDPVDGTNNFAAGKPPFGILIALAEAGETIAGWIWDPLRQRLCHAHRGQGAYVGEDRVKARTTGATPPIAAISLVFADQAGAKDQHRAALYAGRYPALRRRAVSSHRPRRERRFGLRTHAGLGSRCGRLVHQ
jgi:fructose-1,6-bisphosphatase/inositol monophosphatase family enzyme